MAGIQPLVQRQGGHSSEGKGIGGDASELSKESLVRLYGIMWQILAIQVQVFSINLCVKRLGSLQIILAMVKEMSSYTTV